jgi:hypothetical protein
MKRYSTRILALAGIAVSFAAAGIAADAQSIAGRWDANPSRSGCIRADGGMNARGQTPFDLLHVFEHARARPIKIRPVFEHDEDV